MGFLADYIKDGIAMSTYLPSKKKKQPSVIKDLIGCPDNFKFEGWVENNEIHIVIKKNEKITTYNE